MELRNSKKKGVPAPQTDRTRRARAGAEGAQAHASSPGREQHSHKRVRSKPPSERPSRRQRRASEAGPSTASREPPGTDTTACAEPETQAPARPLKKEPNRRITGAGDPGGDRAAAMAGGSSGDNERSAEEVRKAHKACFCVMFTAVDGCTSPLVIAVCT
jgi:hypothetical protein